MHYMLFLLPKTKLGFLVFFMKQANYFKQLKFGRLVGLPTSKEESLTK